MKIGIISEKHRLVIDRLVSPPIELINFTISLSELSYFDLFHSAFATPARYVMEVFRRLYSAGEERPIFVFNPLYDAEPDAIRRTLIEVSRVDGSHCPTVFSDIQGHPIGYYFPSSFSVSDARFLTLLSTVDSELDSELLDKLYFVEIKKKPVQGVFCGAFSNNRFYTNEKHLSIYRWTAQNALKALEKKYHLNDNTAEKIMMRNAIPFAAIMPYHAGDVLFFVLAAEHIQGYFSQIVVNKLYNDIVRNKSALEPIVITSSPPSYAGNRIYEEDYFKEIIEEIPKDRFYYYCRPVRYYAISHFHLLDHFVFALGAPLMESKDLVINTRPNPSVYRPPLKAPPYKVLLHFDGGWPLKVYPLHLQNQLISLLIKAGFEITVFAGEERQYEHFRAVRFENYSHFRELLNSHHVLVGMDSFPCHYAAHVQGLPTICLFANTRPENSNARLSDHYVFMESELSCRPCAQVSRCDDYSKDYCLNFASPNIVFDKIVHMVKTVYEPKVGTL